MGLFTFVKNAGEKLFGSADEKAKQKKVAEAPDVAPELTQEEIDSARSDELIGLIKSFNLDIDSLYVAIEEDLATISGYANSRADKEKAILIAGNIEGIAQVDDRISVVLREGDAVSAEENSTRVQDQDRKTVEVDEPVFHTVAGGESLSKIAKIYYGDTGKYMFIFEANTPMLKSPDLIYPGQVLRIPSLDA